MSAFKGNVYWRNQCEFCKSYMCCKYRGPVELLMARLKVVELESHGCYGSLSFWCDYYQENEAAVAEYRKECVKVVS